MAAARPARAGCPKSQWQPPLLHAAAMAPAMLLAACHRHQLELVPAAGGQPWPPPVYLERWRIFRRLRLSLRVDRHPASAAGAGAGAGGAA